MEIRYVLKNDKVMGTSETGYVFVNDKGDKFHGALFWKNADEVQVGVRVRRIYEVWEITGETEAEKVENLIDKYIEICKESGDKVFDSTKKTMLHWQFINGFSNEIFSSIY